MSVDFSASMQAFSDSSVVRLSDYTNLKKTLENVLSNKVENLTAEFREMLSKDPDWKDLVDYAKVTLTDDGFSVEVQHPLSLELEYGTPSRPMNPMVRNFAQRADKEFNEIIKETI